GLRRFYVARLNKDASVDTTFDTSNGPNAPVLTVAIQPDGKVVIGGRFTTVGNLSRNHIARLNRDGSVDTTFDPGLGWQGQMQFYGLSAEIRAIAIDANGYILAGGT